jgi:hypothetical protein
MKKYLAAALVIAAFAISTAGAQTFSTPVNPRPRDRAQRAPAPLSSGKAVGAFPRAARGNPLQLINPRAPQHYYGPPQETVAVDDVTSGPPYNRGESVNRFTGVILFGFRW